MCRITRRRSAANRMPRSSPSTITRRPSRSEMSACSCSVSQVATIMDSRMSTSLSLGAIARTSRAMGGDPERAVILDHPSRGSREHARAQAPKRARTQRRRASASSSSVLRRRSSQSSIEMPVISVRLQRADVAGEGPGCRSYPVWKWPSRWSPLTARSLWRKSLVERARARRSIHQGTPPTGTQITGAENSR
jgi:hypothetical protein